MLHACASVYIDRCELAECQDQHYWRVLLSRTSPLLQVIFTADLFIFSDQCRALMMTTMMMMIVDLCSALRKAPLLRYVSQCIVKRNVFSADRKDPMLSDGSQRWSGSMFQTIGPATENARRPNLLQRWRGTISWWWVADRRRWRLAMSDVRMQQSIRYCGAGGPWLPIYTGLVERRPTSVKQSEADTSSRGRIFGCQWWHELPHSSRAEACR